MFGFTRTSRLLHASLRQQIMAKANLKAKPAKEVITPAQQAIALTVMFATVLIPSGWVLCHLEDYKHRPGSE
ncbi:cytochrome c oxidase subunit 8B, mitochondrial [Latimeria chalumnae]|uniref:cytochrome c oxidase subunit 8B, mitochondrial n=1 Tax=Latimeria chalumnae TaxID=7897 RepID=UPI0006D940A2|nr:PREDICTED: cytochrome c oxidase subunit 8B, mitochondrial-like [Latimeria chalumnae]|eukprot:XP_014352349.1 PREDICTED: cytochrome c oxidase subunit 8B, mitochondrial-like [Latimeria chalumnae]